MNIYQTDHTKTPEIFKLIKAQQNDEAKKYLKQNPSEIFLKGWMDDTPLHIASLSGNFEMVKYLIENGANVNAKRSGIYATPLCWAENQEIAQYLLDKGATMNDRELYLATRQNKYAVVDLLLSKGARIDRKEPQYLVCSSIECIKIYLKHKIKIDGYDEQKSNLLHKLSWLDLPEVFDFAYDNKCPWQRDSSRRTPYDLARQGRRENILKHFKERYSELISNRIDSIATKNYEVERVFFLRQSPTRSDWFIGLTGTAKLIRYILNDGELSVDKIATIEVSTIRNFTFDKDDNIILPTADYKLLVVEQSTFQFVRSIELEGNLALDQIEYLPSKKIFIGSSQNWEIVVLSEAYKIVNHIRLEDGTITPKINQSETLMSFLSYNQETYYALYHLNNDLSVNLIHTFFKNWDNSSSGFTFKGNEFAVSFPNEIEYYTYENGALTKLWELNISRYKSAHGLSCLIFLDEDTILMGKGKTILNIDRQKKSVHYAVDVDLLAEIRDLYFDQEKQNLIISTDSELKSISLVNIKPGTPKHRSSSS